MNALALHLLNIFLAYKVAHLYCAKCEAVGFMCAMKAFTTPSVGTVGTMGKPEPLPVLHGRWKDR